MNLQKINTGLILSVSILLFFSFIFRPNLTENIILILFVIWASTMIVDMTITVHYKKLIKYEKSILLKPLTEKFGIYKAGIITLCIESIIVFTTPLLVFHEFDLGTSSVVAWWISLLHIQAIPWNLQIASERETSLS